MSDFQPSEKEDYNHLVNKFNLDDPNKINNISDSALTRILNDLELYVIDFKKSCKQTIYIHQINSSKGTLYLKKPISIELTKTKNNIRLYQHDTNLHCESHDLKTTLTHFQNHFYEKYQESINKSNAMSQFYYDVVESTSS